MKIKVRYFGKVQEIIGKEEEIFEIKERDLRSLMKKILRKYEHFKTYYKKALNRNFIILVNGERVEKNKKLESGDVVAFFPIIEGG